MSLFKIIQLDKVETLYGIQKRAHYFFLNPAINSPGVKLPRNT